MTFIMFLAILSILHLLLRRTHAFIGIVIQIPSTFLHELAHYLTAFVLGGKPSKFSMRPIRYELPDGRAGWRLGSVAFRPTLLSAAPAAIAPMWFLLPAWLLFIDKYWTFSFIDENAWVRWSIIAICLMACIPSRQDFSVLQSNYKSTLLWAGIFGGLLLLFNPLPFLLTS